ncbi:hypothetical protein RND71_031154 [Anisodus tanguticus]|uniref:Uncharacterized protein n=1 Tax=Anisodus tanguticus TaxID=243964 RepID=A0AAE1V4J3_9SOLA|nr:hypothetical protein RND71_031154 [Anisodus tanguticus]
MSWSVFLEKRILDLMRGPDLLILIGDHNLISTWWFIYLVRDCMNIMKRLGGHYRGLLA